MLTVRIQEKNYSESIMVLKLKDGYCNPTRKSHKKENFSLTGKREYDMVNKVSEQKCPGSCRRQQVPIRCKALDACRGKS